MLIKQLIEMTMKGGDFSSLADKFALHNLLEFAKGKYIGDIDEFKVLASDAFYSLWCENELISYMQINHFSDSLIEVNNIWVKQSYRGQKITSKFLWFLKTREGFSKILLGDVHSTDTQNIVKYGLSRFDKYWCKDGVTVPFSIDTIDNFYSFKKPSGWKLMLENDGDFSSWPKFKTGQDFIRESYDWID